MSAILDTELEQLSEGDLSVKRHTRWSSRRLATNRTRRKT